HLPDLPCILVTAADLYITSAIGGTVRKEVGGDHWNSLELPHDPAGQHVFPVGGLRPEREDEMKLEQLRQPLHAMQQKRHSIVRSHLTLHLAGADDAPGCPPLDAARLRLPQVLDNSIADATDQIRIGCGDAFARKRCEDRLDLWQE